MTMLDRMRRHRNWLKWLLALVVLAFILLYIPDFLRAPADTVSNRETLAKVGGDTITVAEFRRAYSSQLQAYRGAYGGSLNESLLRQLGIDRQILQQLIDERAAIAEANRLGISATDAEVRERIIKLPGLQENGQFVGEQRYIQALRAQGLSPSDFEDSIRKSIVLDKLRAALTEWITVSDKEVDEEYRRRNEKVKLQLVSLSADRFREGLAATDDEIAKYFEGHKNDFKIGEKRKIRFVSLDTQKLREKVVVTPQDVERAYNSNIQQYSSPEQVRASHILFKTEGKDDAAVKAQAEKVLAEVRAGGDFAALATKYSEDEGSKDKGGDLDYFGKGRMVPAFEQVAFSLAPGSISDLVKSEFGYHIIKVVDKKPASVRPIDEVRPAITEQVKWERAQQQASDLSDKLAAEIKAPADLDKVAKANGLQVQESGFFLRDEPIAGLGPSPEAAAEAFTLKDGAVSGAVRTAQGFAFLTVTGKEESRVPKLDEVKEKVREAVIRDKAVEAARQKAASLAESLKDAADFAAAAKTAGFEAKTTEQPVARGSALPDVGASTTIDAAAFALPVGGVSAPIATDSGIAVVKVVERQDVTPDQLAQGRNALREEMLNDRRGRFFSAYMGKAKQKLDITINREALARIVA